MSAYRWLRPVLIDALEHESGRVAGPTGHGIVGVKRVHIDKVRPSILPPGDRYLPRTEERF